MQYISVLDRDLVLRFPCRALYAYGPLVGLYIGDIRDLTRNNVEYHFCLRAVRMRNKGDGSIYPGIIRVHSRRERPVTVEILKYGIRPLHFSQVYFKQVHEIIFITLRPVGETVKGHRAELPYADASVRVTDTFHASPVKGHKVVNSIALDQSVPVLVVNYTVACKVGIAYEELEVFEREIVIRKGRSILTA